MAHVEDDAVCEQQWIGDDGKARVPTHEGRMRRLNPGEVELSGAQGRKLGRRLIHDDHDKPVQFRRAAQRRGEAVVALEDPAPVGLVRHETKRSIADRMLVERRLAQLAMRRVAEEMLRQDREVGEHVRHGALRIPECQDQRRVIRRGDSLHMANVLIPRIPGDTVERRLKGPLGVARRRGPAIVPAQVAVERKGQLPVIGRPAPAPGQIRLDLHGAVVAHQRGEQHIALHLMGKRMKGEQRVNALEIGAGRKHDRGAAPAGHRSAARQGQHRCQGDAAVSHSGHAVE